MPSVLAWEPLWGLALSLLSSRALQESVVRAGWLISSSLQHLTQPSEGGKTGLTAVTTGLAFFVSIFFAPIFASIPPWATGGALVIVGSMMVRK